MLLDAGGVRPSAFFPKSRGRQNDPFARNDWNQIWYLFFIFYREKRPVSCIWSGQRYTAFFRELSAKYAMLYICDFLEQESSGFVLELLHSNVIYQFNVEVLEMEAKQAVIALPQYIEKNIHRSSQRISVDNIFIRFTLAYPPFPQSPFPDISATHPLLYGPLRHIVREVEEDRPDAGLVHKMLAEALDAREQNLQLSFYHEQAARGPRERALFQKQQCFYIAKVRDIASYLEPVPEKSLCNMSELCQNTTQAEAKELCSRLQAEDIAQHRSGYAVAPLLLYEECIGYLELRAGHPSLGLGRDTAAHFALLARFFSYALSKARISTRYYGDFYSPLVNISKNGLLFELENRQISAYLDKHRYLKVLLRLGASDAELKAKIVNVSEAQGAISQVALEFYYKSQDLDKALMDLVYKGSL